MDIYFTNTLTKQKEKFKPIRKDEVRIYSCGPTVYKHENKYIPRCIKKSVTI